MRADCAAAAMVTLTIRNVPEVLHARLKARARANHRSLSAEAIACLEEAIRPGSEEVEAFLARAAVVRAQFKGSPVTPDELVTAAQEQQT